MSATLRDGARISLRPITPEDREFLRDGFERLSRESRYRRFFAPVASLRESDLDYLTQVDHRNHEALIAFDAESGEAVGVARYVRTGGDVAEPAMAVVDDWQGRGVGSVLLDALTQHAIAEGIRRFEAPVLASNREAIHVLERLGRTTVSHDGREVNLSIELPVGDERVSTWRTLLRAFATGTVEPARTIVQMLWPRRHGAPDDERRNVIVVGTDGSDHGSDAVQAAAMLAAASDATVDVVGVHRFLPTHQADLTAAVQQTAQSLRERGLLVREHVRRGDPALVLTDVAAEQNARLIVVGAGERSKLARRVVGGVADLVAEWAPCSVLIVRTREE